VIRQSFVASTAWRSRGAHWIANARLQPGKEIQRWFSVGKYGEAEAEKLALEARARMVKELLGSFK
jgi:hypothetical protein